MKRTYSDLDDNIPYFITILLFTIFFLSFLGTYTDTSERAEQAAKS